MSHADHWRGEAEVLGRRLDEVKAENKALRRLLALSRGITYGDDGELQCGACQPFIDYKRDSVASLEEKIAERGNRELFSGGLDS